MRLESAQLSFIQPGDEVCPRRRGGAMRDDQAGTVAEFAGQCLTDLHLSDGVEAGHGIVQDQQPCLVRVRERAGQPDSLDLPA